MEKRQDSHAGDGTEEGDEAAQIYRDLAARLRDAPESTEPPSILDNVPPEVIATVDAYVAQLRAHGVEDGMPLRQALIAEFRDSGKYGDDLTVRQYMNVVNENYNLPPQN